MRMERKKERRGMTEKIKMRNFFIAAGEAGDAWDAFQALSYNLPDLTQDTLLPRWICFA